MPDSDKVGCDKNRKGIAKIPGRLALALGRMLSHKIRPQSSHCLFIFSPSLKQHLDSEASDLYDLARLFINLKPVVIVTGEADPVWIKKLNDMTGTNVPYLHYKFRHQPGNIKKLFYAGVIAKWINGSENPVVIGEENDLFYEILPLLTDSVSTIELIGSEFALMRANPFVGEIDFRIFNSEKRMQSAIKLYKKRETDSKLIERFRFVDHMISVPEEPVFTGNEQLEAVFISEGIPDERVHLIAETAKMLHKKNIFARISFVGDAGKMIDPFAYPYCTFYGKVEDESKLSRILNESDVLLLTSKSANQTKLVIEMMAKGKVIVSIENDFVQDYIKDGVNGFLIKDYEKESNTIDDFHISLSILAADRSNLLKMGNRGWAVARYRLNEDIFFKKWKEIIG